MRVIYETKTDVNSEAIVVTIDASGRMSEGFKALDMYDDIKLLLQLKRLCRRWRKKEFGYTVRVITER